MATPTTTSSEFLRRVVSCFAPDERRFQIIRRNGHPHLALPDNGGAALRTLSLYQPQRRAGKILAGTLGMLARAGFHRLIASGMEFPEPAPVLLDPPIPPLVPGTCGIMLGSPEHRIRRAVASYRTRHGWEVAKVAFGSGGEEMLAREAAILTGIVAHTPVMPACLGLHRGIDLTILRMPRIAGTPLAAGSYHGALALLDDWISDLPPRPAPVFPEWEGITLALADRPGGQSVLKRMSSMVLTPVLRHGDFARWNLLVQPNGGLMTLDWEWGENAGMPGLDLVHFLLQDFRLVRRLTPVDAISATLARLRHPGPFAYLRKTGWHSDPLLPLIASLAWKQGAGHQENGPVLDTALQIDSAHPQAP